jgi:predicted aconitase with swiveling domain
VECPPVSVRGASAVLPQADQTIEAWQESKETMAKKTFKGRPCLPGEVAGKAAVSTLGFSTSAAWVDIMLKGSTSTVCTDADNHDLYKKDLGGTILCIPQTIGSSSSSCLLLTMAEQGLGPKAWLFSKHIDSLAAGGLLMADIWLEKRSVTVDLLGDEFLKTVKMGDPVTVHADGTVEIG